MRRWISRFRVRRTAFHKAYPDYVLGDDIGPSQYDKPRDSSFNADPTGAVGTGAADPTWVRPKLVVTTSSPSAPPPGGPLPDEYVDFMRGKRAPRYLSFSEGVDIDDIDLSVPEKNHRRISFRWSDRASRTRSGRMI